MTNWSNCNFSTPTKFSAISHSKKKHVGKHKESDSQDLVQNLKDYKANEANKITLRKQIVSQFLSPWII